MTTKKRVEPWRNTPATAQTIAVTRNADGTYAVRITFLSEAHAEREWPALPRKYLLDIARDFTDPSLVVHEK